MSEIKLNVITDSQAPSDPFIRKRQELDVFISYEAFVQGHIECE